MTLLLSNWQMAPDDYDYDYDYDYAKWNVTRDNELTVAYCSTGPGPLGKQDNTGATLHFPSRHLMPHAVQVLAVRLSSTET